MIQPNTICKLCLAPALQLWSSDQCCNDRCRNYHADIAYDEKFDRGAVKPLRAILRGPGIATKPFPEFIDTFLEHKELTAPSSPYSWRYKLGGEWVAGQPVYDDPNFGPLLGIRVLKKGQFVVDHLASGRTLHTPSIPYFDSIVMAEYFASETIRLFPNLANMNHRKAREGAPQDWMKYMAYLAMDPSPGHMMYEIWRKCDA